MRPNELSGGLLGLLLGTPPSTGADALFFGGATTGWLAELLDGTV